MADRLERVADKAQQAGASVDTRRALAKPAKARPNAEKEGCVDEEAVDLTAWMDALDALPRLDVSEPAIRRWLDNSLPRFLAFKKFVGCYGELTAGQIQMKRIISLNYPPEFLDELDISFDLEKRGCFKWWVVNKKPFLLDPDTPPEFATSKEIEEAKRFHLGTIAACGVIDPIANCGSYLSFAGVSKRDPHILRKLEIVAPTLHALFLASMGQIRSKLKEAGLTSRQVQIVRLVVKGMDDKSIARELGISRHTVSNHLRSIYGRLRVTKRSRLVAYMT